jgi:hypothetical protein
MPFHSLFPLKSTRFLEASLWSTRFSDPAFHSSGVMSLASFLTLAYFLRMLPVAGVAAVVAAWSITSAVAGQILGEGFWREKRVACVPPRGGIEKMSIWAREDMEGCGRYPSWCKLGPNLVHGWVGPHESIRMGRTSRGVRPTLDGINSIL